MSRSLSLVLGGLLLVVGVVWTLQGLDVLGGSAMSGVTLWAIVGPLVALGGIFLIVRSRRSKPE